MKVKAVLLVFLLFAAQLHAAVLGSHHAEERVAVQLHMRFAVQRAQRGAQLMPQLQLLADAPAFDWILKPQQEKRPAYSAVGML